MKIVVDLVRVRQEWDPDTNKHHNSVIFEFAGVTVEVPATPEQVKEIIGASQRQKVAGHQPTKPDIGDWNDLDEHAATNPPQVPEAASHEDVGVSADAEIDESAGGADLDSALDSELTDGGDAVFGGDFEPKPPTMFVDDAPPPPKPAPTATQQRLANITARTATDPSQKRAEDRAAMRARAAQAPPRRVAQDEVGNPIVPVSRTIVGSAGAPTVSRRAPTASPRSGDDDGFGQG